MKKVLEIAAMVGLPLAWGLAVEYVFERIRRRRGPSLQPAHASGITEPGNDWVI